MPIPGTSKLSSRYLQAGSGSIEYYRNANIIEGNAFPPSNQRNPNFAYASPFGKPVYKASPLPKKVLMAQRISVPANILVQSQIPQETTIRRSITLPSPNRPKPTKRKEETLPQRGRFTKVEGPLSLEDEIIVQQAKAKLIRDRLKAKLKK